MHASVQIVLLCYLQPVSPAPYHHSQSYWDGVSLSAVVVHVQCPVAGDAVHNDPDVLQDRADLAEGALNRSERDADAAQKEYVKSLVTRSVSQLAVVSNKHAAQHG